MECRLSELQCRYDRLAAENKATVSRLQAEVLSLHERVKHQADELALLRSCRSSAAGSMSELLKQLRTEHEALLQRQLDDVRSECLQIFSSHALDNYTVSQPVSCTQTQLGYGDGLTGNAVAGRTEAVSETHECTQSDTLTVVSHKRPLSPSFDLSCTSDDGLLAKSTKLF